jgi:hypothetical protein
MVNPTVPSGTNQGGGGNGTNPSGARKVCAGAECGNPIPTKRVGGKGGGYDRFCSSCSAGITHSATDRSQSLNSNLHKQKSNEQGKRAFDTLSPVTSPLEPKKTRVSAMVYDFSTFLIDLESSDKRDLIERVRKLVSIGQSCVAEMNSSASALKRTEDAFNAYKVAFADDAFKAFTARCDAPVSQVSQPQTESSTLVVKVREEAALEQVDAQVIDQLLDASENGPVPQTVRAKEGKVYISFSDVVQSGRAKTLMETKSECKRIFESVNTQPKVYPAIMLNADIADLETLKKELGFRNPSIGNSLKSLRTIFRSPNNVTGHVKIFFNSKRARDEVLKAGRLFAAGRRFRVVEVDLNREVRRCFRCQAYGHIAKSTTNSCEHEEVSGFCAGGHSSKECPRTGQPKCANCFKAHRAGDPSCALQIRAVNRFRAAIEQ